VDKHDLVVRIKSMALELGKTPLRDEFIKELRGGKQMVERAFGNYSALVAAAGLDAAPNARAPKIDNSIFERDLEKHLEEYKPKAYAPPGPYPTAAIISDIHWPFHCQRVIDAFLAYVEEHQPEWVLINGDAWDMYSHSKYPRSHNVFTPREEERLARAENEKFWAEVRRLAPNAKCIQLMGNHDLRPLKRVLEVYPEAEDWIAEKIGKIFTFDGVKSVMDPTEELYLDSRTIVFHGYRGRLGDHRDYTLMNCFNGHTHVGGVVWRQLRNEVIFECNSGIAGDPMAKGLTYRPQKITGWTPGFAVCDQYGPRFIPA
jgi:predicted phosphodiesterase